MRSLFALWALAGLHHMPAEAEQRTRCPVGMYEQADANLPKASSSWRSLAKHRHAFANCDDGYLAEGYSEAVVGLFARHWNQLPEFARIAEQNPQFSRWAIRHIDATASSDDLKLVLQSAARCRGLAKRPPLCAAIHNAARGALQELGELVAKPGR